LDVATQNCFECGPGRFGYDSSINGLAPDDVGIFEHDEFMANEDHWVCQKCPAGKYSGDSVSGGCTVCPKGQITATDGAHECTPCAAQTYAPDAGGTSCKACPATQVQFSEGAHKCHGSVCGDGWYQDRQAPDSHSTGCKICPVGKYAFGYGLLECKTCPSGTYAPHEGQIICMASSSSDACPAGKFIDADTLGCKDCPRGKYSRSPAAYSCATCSAGTFALSFGNNQCVKSVCKAGTYQSYEATDQHPDGCIQCAIGKSQPRDYQLSCESCEFARVKGTTFCLNDGCEKGFFPPDTSCAPCPSGKYQQIEHSLSCDDCPAGTYSFDDSKTHTGSAYCYDLDCPAGRYQVGYAWDTSFLSEHCKACPIGKYSEANGISCMVCPRGQHTYVEAQPACTAVSCAVGQFHHVVEHEGESSFDAGQCMACPAGKHQPTQNTWTCQDCPNGQFQLRSGQASCIHNACAAGNFISWGNMCRQCPLGKFSAAAANSCTVCEQGKFALTKASAVCAVSACPVGKHQGQTVGQTGCVDCTSGRYQPIAGKGECFACPRGQISAIGIRHGFTTDYVPGETCVGKQELDAQHLLQNLRAVGHVTGPAGTAGNTAGMPVEPPHEVGVPRVCSHVSCQFSQGTRAGIVHHRVIVNHHEDTRYSELGVGRMDLHGNRHVCRYSSAADRCFCLCMWHDHVHAEEEAASSAP
jgi:hypothetical protein